MTVSYSESIHLIFKWKGSVWRAVWKELILWIIVYYAIRLALIFGPANDYQHKAVADLVKTFWNICDKIPVSFLLGFYVTQILNRWWMQVFQVAWPDEIMTHTNANFPGPENKYIRQNVARWLILCQAMVFRKISKRIRRRFPTLHSMIDAGLITCSELEVIRRTRCVNNRWQLPLQWIVNKVIAPSSLAPPTKVGYLGVVNKFADAQRNLYVHDWIVIPLVYVQTCSVVVYGYFLFCLIGHQYVGQPVDVYIPALSILQFIFFVGWFKVGQDLIRPFGEDDDDLELNCILDRNAAVAINLADQVADDSPELVTDPKQTQEFVEKMLNSLAYSKASLSVNVDRFPKMRSMVQVKDDQGVMVIPTAVAEGHNYSFQGGHLAKMISDGFCDVAGPDGTLPTVKGPRKIRKLPNLF